MTLKKIGIILFLVFSLFPANNIFAQSPNTGFVQANLWYSKDPFEEGDKIKIYTFVFNPDARELSGTVIFFDKTVLLGKKDFVVPARGTNDVSIDWTATAGDHTIFGKIENAKFLVSAGKYEEVYIAENETEKSSRTVSKKITSKSADPETKSIISSSISEVTKIIGDNVPTVVTEPIISASNKLEEIRNNIISTSENKKKEIKNDIKVLDNDKSDKKESTTLGPLTKPFKYVELFFLSVFSYILGNKILFYGISIIIIFFILRYIWKKISW